MSSAHGRLRPNILGNYREIYMPNKKPNKTSKSILNMISAFCGKKKKLKTISFESWANNSQK